MSSHQNLSAAKSQAFVARIGLKEIVFAELMAE